MAIFHHMLYDFVSNYLGDHEAIVEEVGRIGLQIAAYWRLLPFYVT